MRTLIPELDLLRPARYRRFLRAVQMQGMFPDLLVQGEPYLALNGVVLRREDVEQLRALSERFASALHRAGHLVAPDVAWLVDWGFPWAAAELLAAEPPRMPVVGRFDFLQDQDGGWQLLEFNADTPSGVREAIVADALAHRALAPPGIDRINTGFADALVEGFASALGHPPAVGALGIVTDVSELEDLAQMAYLERLLRPALAARGIDVLLADVDNVQARRGEVSLMGTRVAALYRYVPFEGMFGGPAFAALYEGVLSGRLRLLNGLYGLLLQHKGLLAWLWEHRDDPVFSVEERRAIACHLPAIQRLEPGMRAEPAAPVVVKQVFGREGEEVYLGEQLRPDEWDALAGRRTYVTQRRVLPSALTAAVPGLTGFEQRRGYATVGCFVVNGRWAGCYTRFGGTITNVRAKWVGTWVEEGGMRYEV